MVVRASKSIASRKLLESNNWFLRNKRLPAEELLKKRDSLKGALNSSPSPAKTYVENIARIKALFGKHERKIILMRIIKKARPSFVIDTRSTEQTLEKIVQELSK